MSPGWEIVNVVAKTLIGQYPFPLTARIQLIMPRRILWQLRCFMLYPENPRACFAQQPKEDQNYAKSAHDSGCHGISPGISG